MSQSYLSIVIPAYNEEACLGRTLDEVRAELDAIGQPWDVVVVDDCSTDRTASIVEAQAAVDPRIRLVREPHRGKGAAVRCGMLEASGEWRFLADADLSMPIREIRRFLAGDDGPRADILIGSREAAGSKRLAEPEYRHVFGRLFNLAARWLVVGGIDDTQCGYKMFSATAAAAVFSCQRLDGFGFDAEILFLARRANLSIHEVPITWTYRERTSVTTLSGGAAFLDLLRVRWNQLCGRYPPAVRARP